MRHEALDGEVGLLEVVDRGAHRIAHRGEAAGEVADLVTAFGVGDMVIEVATGDGTGLAAQVEERIEDLPLQEA
jgi:hypothetical protein